MAELFDHKWHATKHGTCYLDIRMSSHLDVAWNEPICWLLKRSWGQWVWLLYDLPVTRWWWHIWGIYKIVPLLTENQSSDRRDWTWKVFWKMCTWMAVDFPSSLWTHKHYPFHWTINRPASVTPPPTCPVSIAKQGPGGQQRHADPS